MSSTGKKRILLVDDDPLFRSTIELDLKRTGYEVIQASNGREALDYLSNHQVDIMLSDIAMPEIDGIELLKKIKEKMLNVPAIMLITGFSDITSTQAYDLGARGLLSKMLNRKGIISAIQSMKPPPLKISDENALNRMKVSLDFKNIDLHLEGQILFVNDNGIAVSLGKKLPQVYDECQLKIMSEKNEAIEGSGYVTWVRLVESEQTPTGCGIEFSQMSEQDRLAMLNFLGTADLTN